MTHSPTLLIVEDDTDSAEIIQNMINGSQRMSFHLLRSDTLADAIERINQQTIDIILLDLDLPDSHGLDTFRQINREATDVPIIIISAHDDENIATTAISEGAQDYLVKNQLNCRALEQAILYAMARKNNEIGSQIGKFIQHKRIEGDLLYLAQHDALTGFANRIVLEDNLNNALSRAKRLHHSVTLQQRIQMENDLHYALKRNEFVLNYQPIIDIKTGKIISLEALIRWNRPDKKEISPSQFIPIAEQSNIILSLGNWIIRTACLQTKLLNKLGITSVAVNVSVHQLNMGMITIISEILKETNFDPNMLVLEITEGTLMQETESNLYILNSLKELGIRLSIDDFGVGYSSLSYLKNFSVYSIKIDRSFITNIPADTNSMVIVSAIITMAHSLNIKTISEGVENQDQLDFLRSKGCDRYQGFFFSEAVSAHDLEKLLSP